ncbi:MAG TPA: MFS transporter [Nitrospira sp.]|nr:MFS transporter [Nitrospira sp.]
MTTAGRRVPGDRRRGSTTSVGLGHNQRTASQLTDLEPGRAGTGSRVERPRWLLTRDFSLIWWNQVLSQVADGISRLALIWFVYSVTGSPLKTSIIGLLQTLPPILFGPLIGVSVDRLPKKAILIGSDVARAIFIGVIPCWVSTDMFTVERLYVLVFLYGIATAMFVPALSASVPFLVGRSRFTAANALLQSTTSIGMIMGPVLSGLGIAFSGSQEVLCANAVTYVAAALCLVPIQLPRPMRAHPPGSPVAATRGDLMEGIRYALISQPTIRVVILLASVYTFGTSALTTLFPVFGKKMLALGPVEVGYLWAWLGLGMFLVSLGLVSVTQWEVRRRLHVVSVSSVIGGAALCGLTGTQDLMLATVLMASIGMGFGTWTPIAWGLIQEVSPAHMVGRVMAIYTAIATATSMAGIAFFGWLTERFTEATSVIGIGVVLFLLALAAAWFSRRITDAGDPADVTECDARPMVGNLADEPLTRQDNGCFASPCPSRTG